MWDINKMYYLKCEKPAIFLLFRMLQGSNHTLPTFTENFNVIKLILFQ